MCKNNTKALKIDGNSINAINGLLSVDLEAGDHTIAKGDTANLFYMVLEVEKDKEEEDKEDQETLDKQAAEKVEALPIQVALEPAKEMQFNDVALTHWAFAHVASIGSKLSEQTLKVVSQLDDTPMTRELLVQVLYEVTGGKQDATYVAENFEDVKDSAYEEAIAYCVQAGLLKGTRYQKMQPQKAVTRAELM